MAKKVKCKNCLNMMLWALPDDVTAENIDYVKQCVGIAKKTFLCGYTMKTKHREHEQYCKNYDARYNPFSHSRLPFSLSFILFHFCAAPFNHGKSCTFRC